MIVGQLVFYEQMGLGKVLSMVEDNLNVVFLFFWPTVSCKESDVTVVTPHQRFKDAVNYMVDLEIKNQQRALK